MRRALKYSLTLVISAILAAVFAAGLCACNNESIKNDVEITFVDANGAAIADTQISISGISDMDIAEQKITDGDGKIVLQNLEARGLSFHILSEEITYSAAYTLNETEVERGYIQVQFSDYVIS